MCLVKSLEIPLVNRDEQRTIQMVNKLCKGILMANKLIIDVVRRIHSINLLLLEKSIPTTPPRLVECDNLLPTFITPTMAKAD